MHAHTHAHTNACTHARAHTNACTHTHTNACTHARAHTNACTHTHTLMHAHTHAHTLMHAHKAWERKSERQPRTVARERTQVHYPLCFCSFFAYFSLIAYDIRTSNIKLLCLTYIFSPCTLNLLCGLKMRTRLNKKEKRQMVMNWSQIWWTSRMRRM